MDWLKPSQASGDGPCPDDALPIGCQFSKRVSPWSSLIRAVCSFGCLGWLLASTAAAQPTPVGESLPAGFAVVKGKHIDVITDMPLSDELRELPLVFDAALPHWCRVFDIPLSSIEDWHVECFLMLDRQRFISAGFLPESISHFTYGFQLGDRLWVTEQRSPYYRRHLMLHEGTHWIMARKYGREAPPWLMEGMAEWLGTHGWDGAQLSLGIIPASREDVPYWGRTKIIQEQLADGVAPSLESILRYSTTAHQQQEAYAWSWAAVVFLQSHPSTAATFAKLLGQPLHGRDDANRWLFKQLSQHWPKLRQEWNAVLGDLDYGFAPQAGMLRVSPQPQPLEGSRSVSVDAARSWQASGIYVEAGRPISIEASGEFVVGRHPKPWRSTADGVSLEYYRGQPLGKLIMTIVAPLPQEPDFSLPLAMFPVGASGRFTVPRSGELQFRINEAPGHLADNSGTLTITISP
jgi:hypothetical protein